MLDFLKKELAGIFFSSKGIVIVQQSGGEIKQYINVPYPSQASGDGFVFSDDIFDIFQNKEVELFAFMQKAIRDSKLDVKKIVVAMPPKDLIIRFFEMPNIPRSEVLAGVNFEMKKYIPFKIEELAYDFQFRVRQKANIIEVILCGIKQDPLDKYIKLFKQLELEVTAFEPGLFSLFRLLVIKNKILPQRSYAILEFDKEGANILIAENGFPYFTRDIKLVSGRQDLKTEDDFDSILFRLINEVRVSLDYYRRQFLKKEVDELIIISNKSYAKWIDNFSKELGLKTNFIALNDLLKIKETSEEIFSDIGKCFGAALRSVRPSLVTLNLGKPKDKAEKAMAGVSGESVEQISLAVVEFVKESKASFVKGFIIGIIILVIGYGYGFSKLFPLEREYASISVHQLPLLPGVDLSSLESIQTSEASLSSKKRDFKALIDEYHPLYKKLTLLSRIMPEGVWINGLSYSQGSKTMYLSCCSYAKDEKLRSANMNTFISNLRKNENFSQDFSKIELRSYKEVSQEKVTYLQFDLSCSAAS